jgi:hypothetical protein
MGGAYGPVLRAECRSSAFRGTTHTEEGELVSRLISQSLGRAHWHRVDTCINEGD